MVTTIGDENWQANQGHMDSRTRWRYTRDAVKYQMAFLVRTLARTGIGGRCNTEALKRLNLDAIIYPDSALARAAVAEMDAASSPALANHCFRTYLWGSLLGQLDGNRWDVEELFVSAILHDLGLTETHHGRCRHGECFTLDCVDGAREVLRHASPEMAKKVSHNILVHLNVEYPNVSCSWEAHYLQAGATFDITGSRYWDLPPQLREQVLSRHPRYQLKDEINQWIDREATLRPGSRMALLRRIGLKFFVRNTPFSS